MTTSKMKKWDFFGATTFFVVLLGCAASGSTVIRGPDGKNWVSITCKRSQANCYEEAGEVCPNGYLIADKSGYSGEAAFGANGSFSVVPTYDGYLLIRCKSR